jgi:hypothetical protein
VREYLIRAADGSGWIPVKQARLQEVFLPRGVDATPCEGWGEVRFVVAGVEVSVSGEEVGWQIVFEGPVDSSAADEIVDRMSKQLAQDSGQPATWSVLTE